MPYIISANYRDRSSPYRWLIREANQPPEMARACKEIVVSQGHFDSSSAYEEGFGCSRVLMADSARGIDFEEHEIVHVNNGIFQDHRGDLISNRDVFPAMRLTASGKVFAS